MKVKVSRISHHLSNGNYNPVYDSVPGTEVREIITQKKDGRLSRQKALVNVSEAPIFLKSGYDTTANGECDDLIIQPGEGIFVSSPGSAYYFASFAVVDTANDVEIDEPTKAHWLLSNKNLYFDGITLHESLSLPIDWEKVINFGWSVEEVTIKKCDHYITISGCGDHQFLLDGTDNTTEYRRYLSRQRYKEMLKKATTMFSGDVTLAKAFLKSKASWKWERASLLPKLIEHPNLPWAKAAKANSHRYFDRLIQIPELKSLSLPRKTEAAQLVADILKLHTPTSGEGWQLI